MRRNKVSIYRLRKWDRILPHDGEDFKWRSRNQAKACSSLVARQELPDAISPACVGGGSSASGTLPRKQIGDEPLKVPLGNHAASLTYGERGHYARFATW